MVIMQLHPVGVHTQSHGDSDGLNLFSHVYERSGIRIAKLGTDLRIMAANEEFVHQFVLPPLACTGIHFPSLLHPSAREPLNTELISLAEGKQSRIEMSMAGIGANAKKFTGTLTAFAVRSGIAVSLIVLFVWPDKEPEVPVQSVRARRLARLTEIDSTIVEGLAAGDTTELLSLRVMLSQGGIEYHVSGLLRKFRVPNRTALVSKLYSLGILRPGVWPPAVADHHIVA